MRDPETEGRLVRGRGGLKVGDALRVVLLAVDPVRGYIDFARGQQWEADDAGRRR